jgi:Fe-S cluster assembly protein SufD
VKASHGATVGQLNPEQLFYLKTRGLTDKEAKAIMVEGFCHEVLSLMSE